MFLIGDTKLLVRLCLNYCTLNKKGEQSVLHPRTCVKKFIYLCLLFICSFMITLYSSMYAKAFVNLRPLADLIKLCVEAKQIRPFASVKSFIKNAKTSEILVVCKNAAKSGEAKLIVEIAKEKGVIKVSSAQAIENTLEKFGKRLEVLKNNGVPYTQNVKEELYTKIAERISSNKTLTNKELKAEIDAIFKKGIVHPVTKVRYNEKGYPIFKTATEVNLPKDLHLARDSKQFEYANKELAAQIEKNPAMAEKFTPRQLEYIKNGRTPEGYTWHHHEDSGKLQLVETSVHQQTSHKGGRSIWGGGKEYR